MNARSAFGWTLGGLLFASFAWGCGEAPATPVDAGPDSDGTVGLADGSVMAPTPPAEPNVAAPECPAGWSRDEDALCAPYPSGIPSCPAGSAAFSDGAGCTTVGAPCPAGPFAAPPPTGTVLYVSPSAASGGDGSAAAPFRRIYDATAAATAGTTILLSKGRHLGFADLPAGVTLAGACAAETSLEETSPPPGDSALVFADAGEVRVRDLTITGPWSGIASVGATTLVELSGVIIRDVSPAGLLVLSGTIEGDGVVIDGATRMDAPSGGHAVAVFGGGHLSLRHSIVSRAESTGVLLSEDSTALLEDVSVRETSTAGTDVRDGSSLTLARVAFQDAASRAVHLDGADASATLTDVSVRGAAARGLDAFGAGALLATRLWVRDTGESHVLASDGAAITVEDLHSAGGARAIRAQLGGSLDVTRARLAGGTMDAVVANGAGSSIVLRDAVVEAFGDALEPEVGRGVSAFFGGSVELERVRIVDVHGSGLLGYEGSQVVARDVSIDAVHPYDEGIEGVGIGSLGGAMRVERARVRGGLLGVYADRGESTLEDLVVEGVEHDARASTSGRGVSVGPGGVVELTRGTFERGETFGVFVGGAGASLVASEVTIRGAPCPDCGGVGGIGLGTYFAGAATLSRFLIEETAVAGVHVAAEGQMDLAFGTVRRNPIGAAVGVPGYDVARLTHEVRYVDNVTNLDTTELPTPDAAGVMVSPGDRGSTP